MNHASTKGGIDDKRPKNGLVRNESSSSNSSGSRKSMRSVAFWTIAAGSGIYAATILGSVFRDIFLWILVWTLLHHAMPSLVPLFISFVLRRRHVGKSVRESYLALEPTKRVYWRRLLRSQVYYLGASLFGLYLLSTEFDFIAYFTLDKEKDPVNQLLTKWSDRFDAIFAAAAGHWALTIYEDFKSRKFLAVDLEKAKTSRGQELKIDFDVNAAIFWAYLVHHVVTFSAYAWTSSTHLFGSLCVMGLTFEVPVLFLNVREFIIVFDKDMNLLRKIPQRGLSTVWHFVFGGTFFFRFNTIVIYLWSILFWRDELAVLTTMQYLLYHVLGIFFGGLNMYWAGLLCVWYNQDAYKVRSLKEAASHEAEMVPLRAGGELGV